MTASALFLWSLASTAPAPAWGAEAGAKAATAWPLDGRHFDTARIWPISRGAHIEIAVVDSGVDGSHPALAGSVLPGADFTGSAVDGRVDQSADSHGTSVAGVIAGHGAPGEGGATGLAPAATILPVRVAEDAAATPTALAQGIGYAVQHGAKIINISLTLSDDSPELDHAVRYALRQGVIVVAAAGNSGQVGNPTPYPAALPGVLAVAGTTPSGAFWPLSGSGPYVSLAAPAEHIRSLDAHHGYRTMAGTSYAAPYVAASAALVWSKYPGESAGQIISRLITTADRPDRAHGRDDHFGYGVVDPLRALAAPVPHRTSNPLSAISATRIHPSQDRGGGSGWIAVTVTMLVLGTAAAGTALFVVRRRRAGAAARNAPAAAPRGTRSDRPDRGRTGSSGSPRAKKGG